MESLKKQWSIINELMLNADFEALSIIEKDLLLEHVRRFYEQLNNVHTITLGSSLNNQIIVDELIDENLVSEALNQGDILILPVNPEPEDLPQQVTILEEKPPIEENDKVDNEQSSNKLILDFDESDLDEEQSDGRLNPLSESELDAQLEQLESEVFYSDIPNADLEVEHIDATVFEEPPITVDTVLVDSDINNEEQGEDQFIPESSINNNTDSSFSSLTDFKVWKKDIRSFIGINDKFNFIAELFDGNAEAYDEVLNEINIIETQVECLQFLEESGITTLYKWQSEGESEQNFMNILTQFFKSR